MDMHDQMGANKSLEDAERASNFLTALLEAVRMHPYVFVFVMLMIAFALCFLPNGVIKALIEQKTEKRKLDARATDGRRKLTAGRQNRSKRN